MRRFQAGMNSSVPSVQPRYSRKRKERSIAVALKSQAPSGPASVDGDNLNLAALISAVENLNAGTRKHCRNRQARNASKYSIRYGHRASQRTPMLYLALQCDVVISTQRIGSRFRRYTTVTIMMRFGYVCMR